MIRSVWLASIFLVFIGALAAFKVGTATPSPQRAAAVAHDAIEADVAQDALAKADKLDDPPDRKPVQSIAIVPPKAAPLAQEKPAKIVSRHWRDSNAKVKKRKHYRHYASRKKHRRAHR